MAKEKTIWSWVALLTGLLALWPIYGFTRAKLIEASVNRQLADASPDAFGGVLRDGQATVDVELLPMLVNPFQQHPEAELKVNGVVRAIIQVN